MGCTQLIDKAIMGFNVADKCNLICSNAYATMCTYIITNSCIFTNAMHIILDYKMSNQLIVCMYMHYQTFIALAIVLAAL